MNKQIIVTGGAGYIGSHTIIEILEKTDFGVISLDNFSNSTAASYDRIRAITGKNLTTYEVDLCDRLALEQVFLAEKNIAGIIHFAAFKLVPESVSEPLKYYTNNINSLVNIVDLAQQYGIKNFIFSSSCSVYGNIKNLPVSEDTPLNTAESPYAYTKQIGERILQDSCQVMPDFSCIALRYFNPVGAHTSGLIGDHPLSPPTSLIPVITKTAIGEIPEMCVHGTDYDTRDGSCIRDYIHVSDIAEAHVVALNKLMDSALASNYLTINLGTGQGISVREAIQGFEKLTKTKLNYKIGPRRAGDVESIYSDTTLAEKILNWTPKHNLDTMLLTAWNWEKKLEQSRTQA